MEGEDQIQIISFYEFKELLVVGELETIKAELRSALIDFGFSGTIIIAAEGYNGMACGDPRRVAEFVVRLEKILKTELAYKSSFYSAAPFRKIDVKIKSEIVTLRRAVDISLGTGTHVSPSEWNRIISDENTLILDTRNDYEYQNGTFRGAVNPRTGKFSDLPSFVAENLDPAKHKNIAMFCTGGIRCEKFAPYMKQIGFETVYQLKGGILKYLEDIPDEESLWDGECFVFDDRRTVDKTLRKGSGPDYSQKKGKQHS